MPKVLTYGNGTDIGAYRFPDRKKICLCIRKECSIVVYGTFNSEELAEKFMDELADFLGAVKGE
jgi:hypothetical protein